MLKMLDENTQALVSPIYQLVPYPGTEIFEYALSKGFRHPAALEDWRDYHSGGIAIPWQPPKRRREMGKLYFLSIFVDAKLEVYDTHLLYRFLARFYRPIARFRLKRGFLALMPEYYLFRYFFDIS